MGDGDDTPEHGPGEVELHLHGPLTDFVTGPTRAARMRRRIDGHPAVKDMLEAAGVPHPEIARVVVNGRVVRLAHRLAPGDLVEAFPAADDDPTEPDPRFVLDGHLGRLASRLRMCGFDTAYRRDADDAELAALAATDDRILLTRDVGLLKRSVVRRGAFVRSDRPSDQLVEVLRRYRLADAVDPFSRCLRCNGRLLPVERDSVRDEVPPRVFAEQEAFRRCGSCRAVYWRGSHHRRMSRLLEDALDEVRPAR